MKSLSEERMDALMKEHHDHGVAFYRIGYLMRVLQWLEEHKPFNPRQSFERSQIAQGMAYASDHLHRYAAVPEYDLFPEAVKELQQQLKGCDVKVLPRGDFEAWEVKIESKRL